MSLSRLLTATRGTTIRHCLDEARKRHNTATWDDLYFQDQKQEEGTLLSAIEDFWDNPILVCKYPVTITADIAYPMNVPPDITIDELWKRFSREHNRVIHTKESGKGRQFPICTQGCEEGQKCGHTWFVLKPERSGAEQHLEADDRLYEVAGLSATNFRPLIIWYEPPAFTVTLKEKDEKNQVITTPVEIKDDDKIIDLKNKYSRAAEEGLVEGDLLLLDDQELKDDRTVHSYGLRKDSQLIVQKKIPESASLYVHMRRLWK